MSAEPLDEVVSISRRLRIPQAEEEGVVISLKDYDRLIERLEACKPGGWADLWLAGAGAGGALLAAALVAALTLSTELSGISDAMWAVTAAGAVTLALCLVGYLADHGDRGREIAQLGRDLEIRRPGTG
jgi:hypothetical protein